MGGFGTQRPLRNGTLDSWVEQKQPQRYEDESFDEAAFERAFDAAKLQIIDQEEILAQQDGTQTDADMLRNGLDDRLAQTDHLLEEDRIGADIVPWQDPKQQEEPLGKDDPDELARTAGQLLDSVKDDQSAKFRESNFLALMRRLRDKEVVVEGDKMVDVSSILPVPESIHLYKTSGDFVTCRVFECSARDDG